MKFYIQNFGCKVSQYESQAMREAWQEKYMATEVDSPEEADVLCIASCAVTREGVTDARQLCNKWRRNFPHAHILVTGCAVEVAKDDFINANAQITQKARHILLENNPLKLENYHSSSENLCYPPFEIQDFKRSRPVVKVQEGCSHLCSYCIVPYTRGPSRSRPLENILKEVETLLEKGFREIVLSGINLRQYSFQNLDFWDILSILQEKFAKDWENKARFRLSSLEPAQLNKKGIETLTRSNLIAPHLHLSLQSGSQRVLEKMRREHYTLSSVQKSLDKLSEKWPLFGLGADFLMGFPSESEEEFLQTIEFINNIPLTYAHVFPYSQRPGTLAAKMPKQIEKHIKQERAARVRQAIEDKRLRFITKILNEQEIILSFDIHENEDKILYEGIDQYYNSCKLESHGSINKELQRAKALSIEKNTLIVTLIHD